MHCSREEKQKAIRSLSKFIKKLSKEVGKDKVKYREWRKENEKFMERCFWYERKNGMPSITSLVTPFFHPNTSLIGLNYSPVAHLTLHKFSDGWTLPLRICRGVIFGIDGNLVALAFLKFFNYNEHPETKNLPDEAFTATVKHDGHLGIIFRYQNKLYITTRGSFVSPTSILGTEMLANYEKGKSWSGKLPENLTILAEIIHPKTKVHVVYRKKRFILIGANNTKTLQDYNYNELLGLGRSLGLDVTERWNGNSLNDLKKLMQDLNVRNQEGFVVRFESGLRVKFKFASYINLMVQDKLSYTYLMNRITNGNLEKMIGNLPEEIYDKAQGMVSALMKVKTMPGSDQEKWEYLYKLVPKAQQTPYFKAKCRAFYKSVSSKNS